MIAWQQRFTSSYGSRRFAACDCWTQTSVAVNAPTQWLLIAVSHAVLNNAKRKIAPLKPMEVTLFTMILYNSENNIRDWRPFCHPLFYH